MKALVYKSKVLEIDESFVVFPQKASKKYIWDIPVRGGLPLLKRYGNNLIICLVLKRGVMYAIVYNHIWGKVIIDEFEVLE